jgi:4,5-DOPA dioxygenase extradiol
MNRKRFLEMLTLIPVAGVAMKLDSLNKIVEPLEPTSKMPALFLGHGSPMNAIEDNEFSRKWKELGKTLPKPNAILCISAHWETNGTFVTAMEKPKTIHDFGGFPPELFAVQYPAPGDPELAGEVKAMNRKSETGLDERWGLDHGCWSVVKNLYPAADIPVVQLSLDYNQPAQYHYDLAKQLTSLRSKGVLIIGSGNIVHNLGMVDWARLNEDGYGYDWALEANEKMKKFITDGDHSSLIHYPSQGKAFNLAIPTPEHFLPLLYTLALKAPNEQLTFFNDKAVGGSLTMTSLKIES